MVPETRLKKTIILTGPTASGKSSLALGIAESRGDIELINADSIQVYKKFDIGSAKPSQEELSRVPHHLIDILEPTVRFTAGDFVKLVKEKITEIRARNKIPLIVGGTGFYLKALLYGMWDAPPTQPEIRTKLEKEETEALYEKLKSADPDLLDKVSKNDRYRIIRALEIIESSGTLPSQLEKKTNQEADPAFTLLIIDREQSELVKRIDKRTTEMLEAGLVNEVKSLLQDYPDAPALKSVGYQQVVDYLGGILPSGRKVSSGEKGLSDEISLATRQLVKRQRTWFRGQTEGSWFILDSDRSKIEAELKIIE
ncbi:MAG: tRNA (adenosine(37)-N6)-dimethylallyltransferase MiaA [Xanthomonadaceae bacterium]|nr:tRNA (adenosine(37)-N6)-dimethylallyltransferase MiaA [Xanthomonadaceae bacterium]